MEGIAQSEFRTNSRKSDRLIKGIRKGYRLLLILVLFLVSSKVMAPQINIGIVNYSPAIDPYFKIMNAVIQVESSGNTMAWNKEEEAVGAFQIRPIRLLDFNQRTGKNYSKKDLYNLEISKEIFLYYAKRIGYHDLESIARNWNGSGKATIAYWSKVKSKL